MTMWERGIRGPSELAVSGASDWTPFVTQLLCVLITVGGNDIALTMST